MTLEKEEMDMVKDALTLAIQKHKVYGLAKEEYKVIYNHFNKKYKELYGILTYNRIGFITLIIKKLEKSDIILSDNTDITDDFKNDLKKIFGEYINISIKKKDIQLHQSTFFEKYECIYVTINYNANEASKIKFINFNNVELFEIDEYIEKKEFNF